MKKGKYNDTNVIYDTVNYCLNHDLQDYMVAYLPVRIDYLQLDTEGRRTEVQNMVNFWNTFLDIRCRNYGKRLNHFIIGIGYSNQKHVVSFANLIMIEMNELLNANGFIGVIAYHVSREGYHHLHILISTTNIYGESCYSHNINAWCIEKYLNCNIPGLEMEVVSDD
jgi:hypothetical protein